jgi:hypothetical protein
LFNLCSGVFDMGWSFRKSKKLIPGVRATLSHRGIGFRLGSRHAGVSVTPTGARVSGSIPGTGISARKELGSKSRRSKEVQKNQDIEIHYVDEPKRQPSKIMSAILLPIYLVGFLVFAGLGIAAVLQPGIPMKVIGAVVSIIAVVVAAKSFWRLRAFT